LWVSTPFLLYARVLHLQNRDVSLRNILLNAVYTQYCFVPESRGFFESRLSVNLALLQIRPRMKQCR
jgi:hypothetical protein